MISNPLARLQGERVAEGLMGSDRKIPEKEGEGMQVWVRVGEGIR